MKITFDGGTKVTAHYKDFAIYTDQPLTSGGDNTAPSPFDLFLGSIGTCAGFFVSRFCQQREISTEGLELDLEFNRNESSGLITDIIINLKLPATFPSKYKKALLGVIDSCTVKKHIINPPAFKVNIS